ncbi:MAG: hypothetical protein ABR583_13305 [Gaiellaceae bacterium]
MNTRLALLAGGLAAGGAALYGLVRRRPAPLPQREPDPRADALREKLAESRAVVGEQEEFEAAETPIDVAEAVEDVEARRRAVHERARAAADEMRRAGD